MCASRTKCVNLNNEKQTTKIYIYKYTTPPNFKCIIYYTLSAVQNEIKYDFHKTRNIMEKTQKKEKGKFAIN